MGRPKGSKNTHKPERAKRARTNGASTPLFPRSTAKIAALRVHEIGIDTTGEYTEEFEETAPPSLTELQLCDEFGELWLQIDALDAEGKVLESTRRDFRAGKHTLRSHSPKVVEVSDKAVVVPAGLTSREQSKHLDDQMRRRVDRDDAYRLLEIQRQEHTQSMAGLVSVVQNLTRDPASVDKRVQQLESELAEARADLRRERAERRAEHAEHRAALADLAHPEKETSSGGKEMIEGLLREAVPRILAGIQEPTPAAPKQLPEGTKPS